MTSQLFTPFKIRDLTLKNRIIVAPMCQYSAVNGIPNNWHLVHLGSRAVGGAAVIIVEATAVETIGRISDGDLALYNKVQMNAFKPITEFIKEHDAIPAIQLAHAGRKASRGETLKHERLLSIDEGGWEVVAPSAVPFNERYGMPRELSHQEINELVESFKHSARLALEAGFEIIELHSAHGYLLHEFLSPLSNMRTDEYGGSIENRMRFPLMVAKALRETWPQNLPVFVRISATDWSDGGWTIEDSVIYSRELKKLGIDLIDASTGGVIGTAKIPVGPGYQVQFAERIKKEADIATGAVGMITEPKQAEEILKENKADVIIMAREFLREPYWPIRAAHELGDEIKVPAQYKRAY
ncbi:MAG: NADH:flavin oxidoreductase/NADH oxidase [Rhizobacter sp.]|nr:NADH:flavin oxidoreductase/NADH oxidase [Bacteriovorax sp.]